MSRAGLAFQLSQRSERERMLLAFLALVVLPVAIAFLVVVPLWEERGDARTAAAESKATLDWVAEQVSAFPADFDPDDQGGGTAGPIGISGIEDSLVSFGLRETVSQLANQTDAAGIDLSVQGADFGVLTDWLATMQPAWGYAIGSFRIETDSPGLVNATFTLEPL